MPTRLLLCAILSATIASNSEKRLNAAEPPIADAGGKRPNLVFLLTDDQTTYSLGCYGNRDVQTPHLDRLSRDGMTFDRHYDTTAICMGSRANIFTGKYEFKHGCNFSHGDLLNSHWQQAYPLRLRRAGYRVGIAGKIGITVTDEPNKRGRLPQADFDAWGAGPGQTSYETKRNVSMAHYAQQYPHSTRSYGAFGRDFILQAKQDSRSFCLSISFKAPHRPTTPDPKFDHIYRGKTFERPQNYGREHAKHLSWQSKQGRQYARFTEWEYDRAYDRVMATYHQQVYAVDVAVGMIRDAIRQADVENNTLVIFTSDNGFLCGSHGYGSKVLPYEEASRAPLIVFDPREPASHGKRCDALTGNVDMAPTLMRAAGITPDKDIDGRSLLPLLKSPEQSLHDWLPLINVWGPREVHSLGVVTKQWKYVYWPYAEEAEVAEGKRPAVTPTEELFAIAADPLELKLSHDPEALVTLKGHYRDLLKQWTADAVPYHGYTSFAKIFDPNIPWPEKRRLFRNY